MIVSHVGGWTTGHLEEHGMRCEGAGVERRAGARSG